MTAKEEAQELYSKIYGMTPVRGSVSMIEQDKDLSKSYALLFMKEKLKLLSRFHKPEYTMIQFEGGFIDLYEYRSHIELVIEELKKL